MRPSVAVLQIINICVCVRGKWGWGERCRLWTLTQNKRSRRFTRFFRRVRGSRGAARTGSIRKVSCRRPPPRRRGRGLGPSARSPAGAGGAGGCGGEGSSRRLAARRALFRGACGGCGRAWYSVEAETWFLGSLRFSLQPPAGRGAAARRGAARSGAGRERGAGRGPGGAGAAARPPAAGALCGAVHFPPPPRPPPCSLK